MFSLPSEFLIFLNAFKQLFSKSVWNSAHILVMGTLLCQGNRTVSLALRTVGLENSRKFRNSHNVLSRAQWSSLAAAKILFGLLVIAFVPVPWSSRYWALPFWTILHRFAHVQLPEQLCKNRFDQGLLNVIVV